MLQLIAELFVGGLPKICQCKTETEHSVAVGEDDGSAVFQTRALKKQAVAVKTGKTGEQERGIVAAAAQVGQGRAGVKGIHSVEAAEIHTPIAGSKEGSSVEFVVREAVRFKKIHAVALLNIEAAKPPKRADPQASIAFREKTGQNIVGQSVLISEYAHFVGGGFQSVQPVDGREPDVAPAIFVDGIHLVGGQTRRCAVEVPAI